MTSMLTIGKTAAAVAALVWLAAAPALGQTAAAPAATALQGVVNINTATADELELLPGIGPARARAILEHRKAKGEFKQVDDLRDVGGIGDRALEALRPHCVVTGRTTARRPD
jgi:comEA protein